MEGFIPNLVKSVRQQCSDHEEEQLAGNASPMEQYNVSILVSSVSSNPQGEKP
jgi:hypothetical protein